MLAYALVFQFCLHTLLHGEEILAVDTDCGVSDPMEVCLLRHQHLLTRHMLNGSSMCNDGSPAGYYLRRNQTSKFWILFLEGGWYCHDEASCDMRMAQSTLYSLTSSKMWPASRYGDGLLSPRPSQNPLFWSANHVYLPYCSSDLWTGTSSRKSLSGNKIWFHGSQIIHDVAAELIKLGIKSGDTLLMAGSSAGGIGVFQNIDRISSYFENVYADVQVAGFIDSGWFLDSDRLEFSSVTLNYSRMLELKAAVRFWNAMLAPPCTSRMSPTNKHRCFFAEEVISLLKKPLFIFQWLYDTAQLWAENRALEMAPTALWTPKYMKRAFELGERTKKSLSNTGKHHGVFAPACLGHTMVAPMSGLAHFKIQGRSIMDALSCWLKSSAKKEDFRPRKGYDVPPCQAKLIDSCSFVQCHENCPPVVSPVDGTELTLDRSGQTAQRSPSSTIDDESSFMDLEFLKKILSDLQKG